MIIAAVIVLIFFGGSQSSLNLSDPEVLAAFSANVGNVVEDPARAEEVVDAAVEISAAGRKMRSDVDGRVEEARRLALSYTSTLEELNGVFDSIEADMLQTNQQIIESRERIRTTVTKREWKKLLKVAD